MNAEELYRYDNTGDQVYLSKFPVVSSTAKGKWIDVWGKKRFVLDVATKRFAYPTRELARESFIARKTRQRRILQAQLDNTTHVLRCSEKATVEQMTEIPPKDGELIFTSFPLRLFNEELTP